MRSLKGRPLKRRIARTKAGKTISRNTRDIKISYQDWYADGITPKKNKQWSPILWILLALIILWITLV